LSRGESLKDIGEFGFIDRISGRTPATAGVVIGIGDDAAAVEPTSGRLTLLTTDMLVEGVHFVPEFTDPSSLGKKVLSVNLSDIAAMGGVPRHFLLSLAVPPSTSLVFLDECVGGMLERAAEFDVVLIGGDTCSSPDRLVFSVTVLGDQLPKKIVRRSGARPGDLICVTGTIGDSALGLQLLKQGERRGPAIIRHLDPSPRVREGMGLADACIPSAMIDVSDGLLADLGHILQNSDVGARVYMDALPLSRHFRDHFAHAPGEWHSLALTGGEDYELLFTVHPDKKPDMERLLHDLGTPATEIGVVTEKRCLTVIDADGSELKTGKRGYDHFSHDSLLR